MWNLIVDLSSFSSRANFPLPPRMPISSLVSRFSQTLIPKHCPNLSTATSPHPRQIHFNPLLPRPIPATFTPSPPSPFQSRCSVGAAAAGRPPVPENDAADEASRSINWKMDAAEIKARVAKLGLAAVLAYGLFDAVTYTSFFVAAFLGYEKATGKNPAANLQALLGIVILMWTGNNVTRPFRVAGAAALAPFIDKGLKKIQKYLNLPKQIYAFALVVSIVAGSCFTIVGILILSKWGK